MGKRELKFRHEVIDPDPPGSEHDITLIGDINGDGRNEIVIGGKKGPPNLFWYENPGWRRHDMAAAEELEAGGVLVDLTHTGLPDVVAGTQYGSNQLYWFENPADPTQTWPVRLITDRFEKYHDQAVGDVDGDGKPELVFLSQQSGVLAYFDLPADPRVEPWPEENLHVIAEGTGDAEGLWIGDIEGNGRTAILAGTSIYRPTGGGKWASEPFLEGYVKTRLAVADLTGDGSLDIVVAEGESHPGRLAVLWGGAAEGSRLEVLRDDLFHPHSLEVADFDGSGRCDIFIAEMGLGKNPDPRMLIFRNLGAGEFEEFLVARGVPTHEAKVGDLTGKGGPDIVGKPYEPQRHIDVWFNETLDG